MRFQNLARIVLIYALLTPLSSNARSELDYDCEIEGVSNRISYSMLSKNEKIKYWEKQKKEIAKDYEKKIQDYEYGFVQRDLDDRKAEIEDIERKERWARIGKNHEPRESSKTDEIISKSRDRIDKSRLRRLEAGKDRKSVV